MCLKTGFQEALQDNTYLILTSYRIRTLGLLVITLSSSLWAIYNKTDRYIKDQKLKGS